jgi:hypothetical protein
MQQEFGERDALCQQLYKEVRGETEVVESLNMRREEVI